MEVKLAEAIIKLFGNVDFSIDGDTLDGLKFTTDSKLKKPTQAEVDVAIAEIIAERETVSTKAATDKANALAKLAGLGLTEDEAKAVIGI